MKKRFVQMGLYGDEPEPREPKARAQRPNGRWALGTVREWLRDRVNAGVTCPCCGQHAKVYKRPLNGSMAHALLLLSRAPLSAMDAHGFVHMPSYLNGCGLSPKTAAAIRGDWAKLVHWDLIEPAPKNREDGSARTGEWRITTLGIGFANRQVRVLSHLRIYNQEPLGLTGKHVWITDVLGKEFDYEEIMATAEDNPIRLD